MFFSLVDIGKVSDKRSSNLIRFMMPCGLFFLHMHVGVPAKNLLGHLPKKFMNKDCKSLELVLEF